MLGKQRPRYELFAYDLDGDSIGDVFEWRPNPSQSYWPASAIKSVDKLVRTGSVTTTGFPLVIIGSIRGKSFTEPRFVKHDGTYYKLIVESSKTVREKRWVFWFDRTEKPTDPNAKIVEGIPSTLSKMDHEIMDTALSLTTDEHGTSDNEDKPLDERGFEYIDGYDPSESALVPTPPFTHLKYASGDGPVYFKAKAEQGVIELTEYTHTISPVAESKQEYEQYLRDEVLATDFSSGSLSDRVQKIVDKLVGDSGLYHETPELSDSYQTVLKQLGLANIEPPEKKPHSYESHGSVYFAYEDKWYATALSISYK